MMLQGAVAFVLLIACANVAGLLLATRRESGVTRSRLRMTLGAGRGRIVRQVLTESLPLAMLGATFGVLLAWLGLKAVAGNHSVGISPPRGRDPRRAGAGVHRGV